VPKKQLSIEPHNMLFQDASGPQKESSNKGKHASSTQNRRKVSGGFVSLLVKGILIRQKSIYSIHYRLIPYMRKKANLEYGQAIREVSTKR